MPRGIDHLVLAAHDLEAQANFYRQLGFTVGARNRHSWGTLNHIVQFPGTFLELITTEPGFTAPPADAPVANFAGFIANYLAHAEGFAMLVLESKDATADLDVFKAAHIAKPDPFFFERKGKRPDGSDVHVAFTLAFAQMAKTPDAGFFVCQQHYPENFWNPAFQKHANGVTGVAAVTFEASDINSACRFFADFSGAEPREARIDTGRGAIEVHQGSAQRFTGVRFACPDLAPVRSALIDSKIAFKDDGHRLMLAPEHAFGAALAFEVRA